MLTWNETTYETRHGIKIKLSTKVPTLTQSMVSELEKLGDISLPKMILTDSLMLKEDRKDPNYKFKLSTGKISVLDGYVNVDKSLLLPRITT
jgi:hypothetical protein